MSPERAQLEILLTLKDLCAKAHEHYTKRATGESNVDTYLLGAAEGYASVGRYVEEGISLISESSGLDVQVVWDEMEKRNQDLSGL